MTTYEKCALYYFAFHCRSRAKTMPPAPGFRWRGLPLGRKPCLLVIYFICIYIYIYICVCIYNIHRTPSMNPSWVPTIDSAHKTRAKMQIGRQWPAISPRWAPEAPIPNTGLYTYICGQDINWLDPSPGGEQKKQNVI